MCETIQKIIIINKRKNIIIMKAIMKEIMYNVCVMKIIYNNNVCVKKIKIIKRKIM